MIEEKENVNKINQLSDEDFIELIRSSTCIKEVLFKLGYTTTGNSWGYKQVKLRMTNLKLESSEFKGKSPLLENVHKKEISNDIMFQKNNINRNVIRKRIIRDNLIDYKCSICGISHWNGKILSLELDHINGVNNDNRLENLRFLCPNCHSQTSTYGSKNKDTYVSTYEITRETEETIEKAYNELHNIKKVSKKTGIRLKIVKEIINKLGLNKPNLKFVIRYDKDMKEIARFGSIAEVCKLLIENNELKTKKYKTSRATFLRNCDKFWLNSYWKILDA